MPGTYYTCKFCLYVSCLRIKHFLHIRAQAAYRGYQVRKKLPQYRREKQEREVSYMAMQPVITTLMLASLLTTGKEEEGARLQEKRNFIRLMWLAILPVDEVSDISSLSCSAQVL